MIWCHSCQKQTTVSLYSNTCSLCGSPAIEQMGAASQPSQFIPYVIGQQLDRTDSSSQAEQGGYQEVQIPITFTIQTILAQSLQNPGQFTVIRIISSNLNSNNKQKSVPKETIEKLEKVSEVSQCTICQQGGGEGLKLKCSHCFHKGCLLPWVQKANSCPTCRTQIKN